MYFRSVGCTTVKVCVIVLLKSFSANFSFTHRLKGQHFNSQIVCSAASLVSLISVHLQEEPSEPEEVRHGHMTQVLGYEYD